MDQVIKAEKAPKIRRIKIGRFQFALPQSRAKRLVVGFVLVFFGFLGFLPILGFWMIPLGLWVLSLELSSARRMRRRFTVWWQRRKQRKQASSNK